MRARGKVVLLSGAGKGKVSIGGEEGKKKAITGSCGAAGDGETQRLSSGSGVSRLSFRRSVGNFWEIEYFNDKNGLGRFFFPFSSSERRRRQWWLYY